VNSDGTKNIAIICTDESGCSTVLYGTSASEAECVPLQDYSAPILVYQTAYVCWEAYDTTGNKATGSQKITFGVEGDSDRDGIQDTADKCPNTPPTQIERVVADSGSPNYGCSPDEIDSDRDGMPDYWEQQYGLSPYDPNDSYLDLDSDGLTNYEEYLQHTDPAIAEIADSDNDRIPDNKDMCPNTPFGTSVDSNGCPLAPVVTPPAPSAEKIGIFPIILLIFGLLLAGFGAAMLLIPKFKPKPRYAPVYRPQQRYSPSRPSAPAVSPIEEQRRKILEKITREREAKSAERKKFFERFGKEEAPAPVIRETPVEKEFKKPEYSRIPEKITIPESRSEFEKLAKLTEQHITREKSPKQILEMTGASKTQFDRLKSLIKERIGVKRKAPEELTKEQKDEIKNIFSRLGKLKKK
jgi:hypothetical protein